MAQPVQASVALACEGLMSPQTPPPPPPPPPQRDQRSPLRQGMGSWPRWSIWVLLAIVAAALLLPSLFSGSEGVGLNYTDFVAQVRNENVKSIEWNNNNGHINGEFADGAKFTTT